MGGQSPHHPRDKVKAPLPAAFLGIGKQNLKPEADAEERAILCDYPTNRIDHAQPLKAVYGVTGGADAGQDDCIGVEHIIGAAGDIGFIAEFGDGLSHTAQIPGTIVDYRDHLTVGQILPSQELPGHDELHHLGGALGQGEGPHSP